MAMDDNHAYRQLNEVDVDHNESSMQPTTVGNVSPLPILEPQPPSADYETVSLMSHLRRDDTLSGSSNTLEVLEMDAISTTCRVAPLIPTSPPSTMKPPTGRPVLAPGRDWGWWWEGAGVTLSCCCIAVIVGILIHIDNKPLESWTLPIKPNSLISVFSTIAKSALLIPVAECISQLKWMHFDESRALSHVQAFDDASRGPWGSMLFIFRMRMSSVLVSAAAVLTIASLAFEPTSQQIIEYATRNAVLSNITAHMAQSTAWSSKGFADGATNSEYMSITSLVRSGLIDYTSSRFRPHFQCPTSDCQWPTFEALGVCHSCNNTATSAAEDKNMNCTYRIDVTRTENNTLVRGSTQWDTAKLYRFLSEYNKTELTDPADLARIDGMSIYSGWICTYSPPNLMPPVERFNVGLINFTTATRYANMFSDIDLFYLTALRPNTSSSLNVSEPTFIANVTADVTMCELKLCVKRYSNVSVQNNAIRIGSVSDLNLTDSHRSGGSTLVYKEHNVSGDAIFYIDQTARETMWLYLADILKASQWRYYGGASFWRWGSSENNMANFLAGSDLDEVMAGFADSLTAIVQSEDNLNLTMLAGDAIGPVVFVKVHWQWLACPVAIVLLVVCLLVASIIKSSSSPLLVESSPLALLFHSLEGWTRDELVVTKTEGKKVARETAQGLYGVAKGMNARLERNEDGEFAFVKAD